MHKNIIDITGQRFGNLKVLELTSLTTPKKRNTVWKCQCDCGNICYKTGADLRDKRRLTWSCGCMSKSKRPITNYVEKSCSGYKEKWELDTYNKLLSFIKNNSVIINNNEMISVEIIERYMKIKFSP